MKDYTWEDQMAEEAAMEAWLDRAEHERLARGSENLGLDINYNMEESE